MRANVANKLQTLLCEQWSLDSPKDESVGKKWISDLREDLDVVEGPWQLNCSFKNGSSRLDKLRSADTHKRFRAFLWNYRRFQEADDIGSAQSSGGEGEYGPLFVYLWKQCFVRFAPILTDVTKRKRMAGFENPTVLGTKVSIA